MDKLKLEQANAEALVKMMLSKLSVKCFHKCVSKPSSALDKHEQRCISLCVDRYVDSYHLVAHTFGNRVQQEMQKDQNEGMSNNM